MVDRDRTEGWTSDADATDDVAANTAVVRMVPGRHQQ